MSVYVVISLTIFIAMAVGYAGYLAFGSSSKSVIIYNLPNEDIMSIVIKVCYLITVMGSFVLLSQPVFHVIESTYFYKTGRCCGGDD